MTYKHYPWNPFGTNPEGVVKDELVTVSGEKRNVFVPRYAPFFEKDFVLKDAQSGVRLFPGKDFVFSNPFKEFVDEYARTVSGSITLLPNAMNRQLTVEKYSTIGEPFTQDDASFLELVANIIHTERTVDWSQIVNLPEEGFPEDPHEHEIDLTYNYETLIKLLQDINNAMSDEFNNPTVASELAEHLAKSFKLAHPNASPADFNLENVPNYSAATEEDLAGNSDQLLVTIQKARLLIENLLKDLGIYPDQDPTEPGEEEEKEDYLTLEEAVKLFLSQKSLLSEIRALGGSAQATARNNLGLRSGAVANVVQGTGVSESDVMSQKAVSELLGDLTFNTVSWTYTAQGGELSISPPHDFMNCLTWVNGLGQPTGYSFTAEMGVITFAEALVEGDVVEVVMDAPITKSWFYRAIGGETELKPPYEIQNVILMINGYGQPDRYSFTNTEDTIYLAGPLYKDEIIEVIFDVPLTSQNSLFVNKQVLELQAQVKDLQDRFSSLKGRDFISQDPDNAIYPGNDQHILLTNEDLQHIERIDVDVKLTDGDDEVS